MHNFHITEDFVRQHIDDLKAEADRIRRVRRHTTSTRWFGRRRQPQ